jgi:DNA-binding transcriptional ArsR family regulator
VKRNESDNSAQLFAALGDETRQRLLARIMEGPLSITSLTEGSGITRQAVTKHLRVLADAGFVRGDRQGRETIWTIEANALADAREYLDQISARWDSALLRLQALVERREP